MARRWSTRGKLFHPALQSNELDRVTMQFLRNPIFEDERRLTV